jgi:hypothetical protein
MDYNGKITLDTEHAFLNRAHDNLVFDKKEMDKLEYDFDVDKDDDDHDEVQDQQQSSSAPKKVPELSYYEDYGWRTQCKFVVHEASKFRFMRLVSGQDEAYPFVVYDLGWKVL